jgi:hypothetical protein
MKSDELPSYAIQSRKLGLAMIASIMGKGNWNAFSGMNGMANAMQMKVLVEREPRQGLSLFRENGGNGVTNNSWTVLDRL